MPRMKKQMTKEACDQRIAQLEKDIESHTQKIKEKKSEIARLKVQSKELEKDRLLQLVLNSGKDYSELVEILGK